MQVRRNRLRLAQELVLVGKPSPYNQIRIQYQDAHLQQVEAHNHV